MSQNQENQISDQELDSISGGQLSDDNPIFSSNSQGGAGVKAKRSRGRASRNEIENPDFGIGVGEEVFEEIA